MTVILALLAQIIHTALMLAAAPTAAGASDWLDSRLTGRSGPPILAPWRDLVRLSRKTPIILDSVSAASRLAPSLGLGATLSAASLVPSFTFDMAFSPLADVLVIVALLTVARVAAALAALDSGAALPGLAAQSASARAVLAEPALMLAVVALALIDGSFNLDLIIGQQREGLLLPAAASAVALTAMLALMYTETSAPSGGLEQMLSGTGLAIALMTLWLRRLVWIDLIGGLFLPVGMTTPDSFPFGWLTGIAVWLIKLAAFILGLSAIQTLLGRIPRQSLPDLIGAAALLALLAIIMVLASTGGT
jgi:formate hydrogenlyase subunit 4